MNRGLYIVLIPALLVAVGYVIVLRLVGLPSALPRLIVAVVLTLGVLWWLARRSARKSGVGKPQ
ncbi:MAG TPA: hypothetical protein VLX32_05890 [Candidatus Acidoferrum sp.]|nr:hypothetical protein [Candidatus Acidoferrum sp.]